MLIFFAPINQLGYGIHSYHLISAYEKHINPDFALFPTPSAEFQNDSITRWIQNGKRFKPTDPSLMISQMSWLNRFCGSPMIGFPVFELDLIPELDLRILTELDAVLQTSAWGKKTLERYGIQDAHIVPEGYDPEIYYPIRSLDEKLKSIEKQGLSFVHVGKFEARKSSVEILRCFVKACENVSRRVNLLFHVYNPFDLQWFEKIQSFLSEHGFKQSGSHFLRGKTQILVPESRFKDPLKTMYQMAHFGIWASKAEGWNLPLIECIACGIPSLTTNNTAQADFIREGIYPAELILKSHQREPTGEGIPCWPIDEEELTRKIQAMIRDPERFLKMESPCLESIRPFTWENAAKKLDEALQKILQKKK